MLTSTVCSSSSSSSDSEGSESPPPRHTQEQIESKETHPSPSETTSQHDGTEEDDEPVFTAKQQPQASPEQAFEDFYLRQATREFANDLDKLRSTPGFQGDQFADSD